VGLGMLINSEQTGEIWIGMKQNISTRLSMNGESVCMLVFAQKADISKIYHKQLENWTTR